MRIQCPECGILRPASADPCPSCGADAPSTGGARAGSGTSLRQWKQRYQTGQLPGISPGASGIGNSRQLPRRTSGPLTSGPVNPDWGNESPSSSIPPSSTFGSRRSGSVTPPPPPARQSGNLSSSLWQRATDPTPPPPSRSSGLLGGAGRNPGGDTGNSSASWKWRDQGGRGSSGFAQQMEDEGYDDQDGYQNDEQEEMPPQPSGRFRSGSMLPVPYQGGRRAWNQSGDYDEMDEDGSSANLPAPMGMQNSMAFPMMEDSMLERLAPGRKAPAFIPATRPRRPYRLSRYRVLSGTISLALVLMTLVGGLAFLAVHSGLAGRIFGGPTTLAARNYTFQQTPIPTLSGTPQATPSGTQAAQSITNVVTALHYSSSFDPITPTTTFQTGQNVNVLWKVKNAKANDIVSVIWYESGSALTTSSTPNTQKTFPKAGPYNGLFALCYPMGGLGKAELYWNGQLAQTIQFVVQGNPTQCANS
ncbi:MAG TPA: hypothetical protein VH590_18835 [Ktedonobacterales bacterium]